MLVLNAFSMFRSLSRRLRLRVNSMMKRRARKQFLFQLENLESRLALTASVVSTFRALSMEYNGGFNGTTTQGSYSDSYSGNAKGTGSVAFTSPTLGNGTLAGSGTGSGHDNFGNYGFQYSGQLKISLNNGAISLAEVAGSTNYQYTSGGQSGTGGGYLGQVPTAGTFNPSTFAAAVAWNTVVDGAAVKGSSSGSVTDKATTATDIVASGRATATALELTASVTGKFMRTSAMGTPTATAIAYWSSMPNLSGVISTINLGQPINIYWNSGTVTLTNDNLGPAPAGALYVVFKVDSADGVVEASEANNVAAVAISALPPAVLKSHTTVTPGVLPTTSAFGQEKTITAQVLPVAPSMGTPSGTVTFRDGSTVLGSLSLVNGTATLRIRTLTVGTHTLSATYNGSAAFEGSVSASFSTVVVANHAPTLNAAKSPTLTTVIRNAPLPAGAVGTLVSSLVDYVSPAGQRDNVADVDAGAVLGISVTAAAANGAWYFSTNNGTTWAALGTVSNTSVRLLAADAATRIYFRPNTGVIGTINSALTFRAWDRTGGNNGALIPVAANGGSTTFSAQTDTASILINDAPVLNVAKTPVLDSVVGGSGAPSGAVGSLISKLVDVAVPAGQLDNVTDIDSGALLGIAVTKIDTTQGTWFYSINNGTSWLALTASTTKARLLADDGQTRLYFKPTAGFMGTIESAITFRAWDRTAGTNGGTADVTTAGGATSFSRLGDTASINVT
jgi:hypothetical protein